MLYRVGDIMALLQIGKSKAYDVIRRLQKDIESEGYIRPPAGRIQKRYFCKRYGLDVDDCDRYLKAIRKKVKK